VNVIDEVRRLADAGTLEVTLLGQTVNHYAYAHGDGRTTSFADLLYQIHEAVPHLPRLRFVTSYPRDFTDQALQAMRDCPRICRYLHAPAQHGSDRVLRLMNRGYTVDQYEAFVSRARGLMPDLAIASDFIVGFPTETDAEFDQTVDLVRRCEFKNSFIFKYSPRPGTVAIKRLPDDIPDAVKRHRNNELLRVQGEMTHRHNSRLIGQTLDVLVDSESRRTSQPVNSGRSAVPSVELGRGFQRRVYTSAHPTEVSHIDSDQRVDPEAGIDPNHNLQWSGRTRGDHIVIFPSNLRLIGKIVPVRILEARHMTLFGSPE
jgi:tRNA-2-methylthio-N6-dimethylallyladenosine synthase